MLPEDACKRIAAGAAAMRLVTERRAGRVSGRIKAGICWVNTYRAVSPIAPFGGFNQSGYGREAGIEAIHDYTRTKTTWINTSDSPMANPFVMR